jgi:hypothetical protein
VWSSVLRRILYLEEYDSNRYDLACIVNNITLTLSTALGNIVGGGLFVGTVYWYLYLTGEMAVQINFDLGSIATAMEAGGPMRPERKARHESAAGRGSESETVIDGQDPHASQSNGTSSGYMSPATGGSYVVSAFNHELGDHTPYAKTHAERMSEKRGENGHV